jgi:hypothetical protein
MAAIPKDLPPRNTLNDYFRRWDDDGTLTRILARSEPGITGRHSIEQRHQPPGACIFDGPLRSAPLTAPPAAAVVLRLCLHPDNAHPARICFPSANVSPIIRGEYSATAPPLRTSCPLRVPSAPMNSTMIRHFIPPSRFTLPGHITPPWTVSG